MIDLPRDVSASGHLVDALLRDGAITAGIALALSILWLLYALLRPRKVVTDSSSAILGTLAAVAFIALAVDVRLLVGSEAAVGALLGQPGALRVEVDARQWSWSFREAGPDGELGTPDDIVTTDELVVPAGTPIELQLAAVDVIHSFSLPNLRVKTDAIPGTITHTAFTATTPGDYDIACAQLCGVNHYKMKGRLRVLAPADYAIWLAAASRIAKVGFDPDDHDAAWGWPWH